MPAAGIGRRMGSTTPKQYLALSGQSVIQRSLQRLLDLTACQKLVVALHPQDQHWTRLGLTGHPRIDTIAGGDSRQQSVLNGLRALETRAAEDDWVLIHDAVRPCLPAADIEKLYDELRGDPCGGLLAARIDNTLKRVDSDLRILGTVNRDELWQALTPQMFRYGKLVAALERLSEAAVEVTDEAAAMEWAGHQPRVVEGSKLNVKITREVDLLLCQAVLKLEQECR